MKKIAALVVLCLASCMLYAQATTTISYTAENTVLLNEVELSNATTLSEIKEILGEPEVYKEYPTGKVNYHYNDLGIAVHTVNDQLLFLGVNLNWDGDENFPQQPYEGAVLFDDVKVDAQTTRETITTLEVVAIVCPLPDICITKDREATTAILIGFKDNIISQVGFEFH